MSQYRIYVPGPRSAQRRGAAALGPCGRRRGVTALALVLLAAGSGLARAQHPAATARALLFDGVTVVDVERGTLVPDQRVVIVGNRIRTVGSARSVPIPKNAQVVEARGKYLIPGLWDMWTQSDGRAPLLPFYAYLLGNGVTGFRTLGTSVSLDTLRLWRHEILAGRRVGPPRQLVSGPLLDERPRCTRATLAKGLHSCITTGDTADARHVIDSLTAAGANALNGYMLSDAMFFFVATQARHRGLSFGSARLPGIPGMPLGEASDSGYSVALYGAMEPCTGTTATVAGCRSLAERLARNGTWILGAPANQPMGPIEGVEEFAEKFWAGSISGGSFHDYLRRPKARPQSAPRSMMVQAGMPFLTGTGADNMQASLEQEPAGFTLHAELAAYVASGRTPVEILRSVTLNPAKLLRGTDSLGTVAAGKLADLVLLDADPLAEITNTTAIRAVVANGRYFDRTALDRLLTDARAAALKIPPPTLDVFGQPYK